MKKEATVSQKRYDLSPLSPLVTAVLVTGFSIQSLGKWAFVTVVTTPLNNGKKWGERGGKNDGIEEKFKKSGDKMYYIYYKPLYDGENLVTKKVVTGGDKLEVAA